MPKDIRCPKCKSTNTYLDNNETMACLKCAERFPYQLIPAKPEITEDEHMAAETKKKRSKSKPRTCRNCGRVKNIIGDDLCCGCYFAVRGYKKGTPEYDQRLAEAKARFTDPDYKERGCVKKSVGRAPRARRAVESTVPSIDVFEKKPPKQLANLTVTDVMKAERDLLLDRVHKLNTAIELLS